MALSRIIRACWINVKRKPDKGFGAFSDSTSARLWYRAAPKPCIFVGVSSENEQDSRGKASIFQALQPLDWLCLLFQQTLIICPGFSKGIKQLVNQVSKTCLLQAPSIVKGARSWRSHQAAIILTRPLLRPDLRA